MVLFTLACISAFTSVHSVNQKLDFKDKFEFLNDEENPTLSKAVQQIKWRIRSGYLAELNNDINAMRWLVKKLAQSFGVKTTIIASKFSTAAANEYIKMANQYLEILRIDGEIEAKKYQKTLYPEYTADLYRRAYE